MRSYNPIIGVLLFIALLFGGCAGYSPSLARMDNNAIKHTVGDLCPYRGEYATHVKCTPGKAAFKAQGGKIPLYQLLLFRSLQHPLPYMRVKSIDKPLMTKASEMAFLCQIKHNQGFSP